MTAQRRAWAYLAGVAEAPCAELAALVAADGPVDAAQRVKKAQVTHTLAQRTSARAGSDSAAADLDCVERLGGRLVTPDDDEWPHAAFTGFAALHPTFHPNGVAPLALWVIGGVRLDDVAARSAAVVGTRAATAYGATVAAELAEGLCARDVAVVSGGAFGIDGAAHRSALAVDGVTAAVLAGGVDVPYPAGHTGLLRRIGQRGLLISEYPLGLRPARHRFLTRNRLVAALSCATVVVEAGLRSGAANTASWANALGRVVAAVPGPVTSSASVGCHRLIRNGAVLVTRAEEVVELAGRIGELADEPPSPTSRLDELTEDERRVYEALPGRGERTTTQITVECGMPVARVIGGLALLEVAGLACRADGGWRLAARPAAAAPGGRGPPARRGAGASLRAGEERIASGGRRRRPRRGDAT